MFRHLTRQVRSQAIIDVCTWNKGSFAWYAGRENPREAFPLDLNTYEVLGAGAMALPVDTLDAWLERSREVRLRSLRGKRVGPERFEIYRLDDVFESLDGRRTIGEILDATADKVERPARPGSCTCSIRRAGQGLIQAIRPSARTRRARSSGSGAVIRTG